MTCRWPRPPLFPFCLLAFAGMILAAAPASSSSEPGARRARARLLAERLAGLRGDVPFEGWREGPVRYLLTFEEEREFRKLANDAERARFIERFWARRDPNPRTLINEYRMEFWKRVADSKLLFTESSKPGWKTDMGRVYILLGPPDDRDTSLERTPGLSRTGIRGAITWRYARSPAPHIGTGLTVAFTQDPSGEYRLETDPRVVQRLVDGTYLRNDLVAFTGSLTIPEVPPRLTEIGLMLDLGRLDEIPGEEDLLSFIVSAEEYAGVIPFGARYDFFAGSAGTTWAAITLNLHPDPLDPSRGNLPPDYLIVGRIDPARDRAGEEGEPGEQDAAGPDSVFLREQQFQPAPRNDEPGFHGPFVYQAWVRLRPGRHHLSLAAFDKVIRRIGSFSETLEVPSFSASTLSLSSLCLSESIEPLRPDEDRQMPYVIGNLRVTPRLMPIYRNGDTFAVYYQVYSASTDPATRAPDLRIEYQFFVEQPGGYIPIGRPIPLESTGNSAQGWSFPLKSWPAADFRLRVSVTDAISGQTASREVAFKVQ